MNQLTENLIHRLEDKGLSLIAIPRFLKDVASTISINGHAGLEGMNRRLDLLGWGPVEVDYHTLQLIIASLENGGLTGAVNWPNGWFERIYDNDPQGLRGC